MWTSRQCERAIHSVASALQSKARFHIKFQKTPADIRNRMLEFSEICKFPNVIGAVDGSNVCQIL